MSAPTPNGNTAKEVVKALGTNPTLLAMVVLVGILLYVFGERIAARIDGLSAQIERCCLTP